MAKIDHEYTRNIVCPYCGYEDIDSWEVESGEEDLGLQTCGNCEKEFYAQRIVTVEYSTTEAEYGACSECGKTDTVIEDYTSSISIGSYKALCVDCGHKKRRELKLHYIKTLGKEVTAE
ncbi:MAG: hypothetical protein ACOX8Q_01795 [Christensenellales bacterium]|jgi:DNA-directed RNA polymerase subunit RPC12/RpoP